MSWTKKNVHPGKILSTSEEITVQVLEVDPAKRRISLGLKQTQDNPWETFADKFPVGAHVEGEVKNITEFGLFIGLDGDVDGMVHLSDLDWKQAGEEAIKEYKKGQVVKAIVLDVDMEKERISLGVKQLDGDPMEGAEGLRKGAAVTCEVTAVQDNGIEVTGWPAPTSLPSSAVPTWPVTVPNSAQTASPLAKRSMPASPQFDKASRKVSVSIKALEIAEEKAAVAQYGSSDSGGIARRHPWRCLEQGRR